MGATAREALWPFLPVLPVLILTFLHSFLHLLSHRLLVAQFRGQLLVPAVASEVPTIDPQLVALQQEIARLHTTCQEQQAALQRLAQQEAQLLAERDHLQYRIKDLVHQCTTL